MPKLKYILMAVIILAYLTQLNLGKIENTKTTDKVKEKFERLYKETENKTKKERKEIIATELVKELKDTELTIDYVNQQFERKRRNQTERRKRFYRKVY